jgi:DNA gyrase/topoisomerase IV subunit B
LLSIEFNLGDMKEAIETFDMLMGKKFSSSRKAYMENNNVI